MPTEIPHLTRLDPAPINDIELPFQFENWVSNIVDVINENLSQIESTLASLDARITMLGG